MKMMRLTAMDDFFKLPCDQTLCLSPIYHFKTKWLHKLTFKRFNTPSSSHAGAANQPDFASNYHEEYQ